MDKKEIVFLGKSLKKKRSEDGLTQSELAAKLQIGLSTLQALEIGASKAIGKRIAGIVQMYISGCEENEQKDLIDCILDKIAIVVSQNDFEEKIKQLSDLLKIEKAEAIKLYLKSHFK